MVVDLMAQNARSAVFYGGLEEFQELKLRADWAGIALVHRSTDRPQTRLELATRVAQILADLGYPPEAVSAGMEEILYRLEKVAEAA